MSNPEQSHIVRNTTALVAGIAAAALIAEANSPSTYSEQAHVDSAASTQHTTIVEQTTHGQEPVGARLSPTDVDVHAGHSVIASGKHHKHPRKSIHLPGHVHSNPPHKSSPHPAPSSPSKPVPHRSETPSVQPSSPNASPSSSVPSPESSLPNQPVSTAPSSTEAAPSPVETYPSATDTPQTPEPSTAAPSIEPSAPTSSPEASLTPRQAFVKEYQESFFKTEDRATLYGYVVIGRDGQETLLQNPAYAYDSASQTIALAYMQDQELVVKGFDINQPQNITLYAPNDEHSPNIYATSSGQPRTAQDGNGMVGSDPDYYDSGQYEFGKYLGDYNPYASPIDQGVSPLHLRDLGGTVALWHPDGYGHAPSDPDEETDYRAAFAELNDPQAIRFAFNGYAQIPVDLNDPDGDYMTIHDPIISYNPDEGNNDDPDRLGGGVITYADPESGSPTAVYFSSLSDVPFFASSVRGNPGNGYPDTDTPRFDESVGPVMLNSSGPGNPYFKDYKDMIDAPNGRYEVLPLGQIESNDAAHIGKAVVVGYDYANQRLTATTEAGMGADTTSSNR